MLYVITFGMYVLTKKSARGFTPLWVNVFMVAVIALVSAIASYEIARTAPPFRPSVTPDATEIKEALQQAIQLTMVPDESVASTSVSLPTNASSTPAVQTLE